MYDIKSRADASGTNIKERLSKFFDELMGLESVLADDQKKLEKSITTD